VVFFDLICRKLTKEFFPLTPHLIVSGQRAFNALRTGMRTQHLCVAGFITSLKVADFIHECPYLHDQVELVGIQYSK